MVLKRLSVSRTAAHRDVQRASVLLMAGEGVASTRIAAQEGLSPATVAAWRERFELEGLKGFAVCVPGGGGSRRSRGRRSRRSCMRRCMRSLWGRCAGAAARWPRRGYEPGDGAADLISPRGETAPGRGVQVFERPAVRGEARRRRRSLPEPAGRNPVLRLIYVLLSSAPSRVNLYRSCVAPRGELARELRLPSMVMSKAS